MKFDNTSVQDSLEKLERQKRIEKQLEPPVNQVREDRPDGVREDPQTGIVMTNN